jgi:hypothetical protein
MGDRRDWGAIGLAALGIVGTLLGGTLQHFLTLDRERSLTAKEREGAAYLAFLAAFPKSSLAQREKEAGRVENAAKLETAFELEGQAAVRQIALSGDKLVVTAIAKWYHEGGLPGCSDALRTEFVFWERMRMALLGDAQTVAAGDLAAITVFCKLA